MIEIMGYHESSRWDVGMVAKQGKADGLTILRLRQDELSIFEC